MADNNAETSTVSIIFNITGNSTGNGTTLNNVNVTTVINWLTFIIGLPAIALAMYTLKNLSKGDSKMPMHVMLLLITDIISFFGRPTVNQNTENGTFISTNATNLIFYFGVIANITLMLCIAQERHLLVAYPQCLGCFTRIRQSPLVALLVWSAPIAVLALALLQYNLWFAVALLSPFPFLLFFALDSWRALVCSRSNPPTPERRRTVWGIGAIWANYTLLYSPFILSILLEALSFHEAVPYLGLVSHLLLYLSPLVDPFLYLFMTKGLKEVLQAMPCCPNPRQKDNMSPTVDTVSETVETRL